MNKNITKGVELLDEIIGEGLEADNGAVVTYNARFFLRQGDEVTRDTEIISRAQEHLITRFINGVELIDHVIWLGKRQSIAGVEKSIYGMKKCGYRKVLVSPHLAYGEKGVSGLIPANALLTIQLWVQDIRISTIQGVQEPNGSSTLLGQ